MPQPPSVAMAYARLPGHPIIKFQQSNGGEISFKDDLLHTVLDSVFLDGKTIRTQAAYEQTLQENKAQLMLTANDVGKTAADIMILYSDIKTALSKLNSQDGRIKDITEQLALMIYAGFIRHTPVQQLKAIPRYLKAIAYRLDKPDNDSQKIQEISRYATRFWNEVEKKSKKERLIPEQDPFRWMLEEFRVSLFAQQLKTAYPISSKRLDKAWDDPR